VAVGRFGHPAELRPVHVPRQRGPRFYPDWNRFAGMTVVNRRSATGIDPHDKGVHDLVGELSTRSDEFRRRWGAHNVRIHGTGVKQFHHHVVGDLHLAYETMDLTAEPGLMMTIYAAEPTSPTAHALTLLASWAATSGTGLSTVDR
jgi:MmyB-like transcription regulator ligand binding domain